MSRNKIFSALTLFIAILLLVTSLIYYFFDSNRSEESDAVLYIESGDVYVKLKTETDYSLVEENEYALQSGSSVKTEEGYGHVIFSTGSVMSLEANTEIELDYNEEEISIFQFLGSTWHRVEKLLVSESYEVETSNTLAAVRGTSFGVNTEGLDSTLVVITENNVDVSEKYLDEQGEEKLHDPRQLSEGQQVVIDELDDNHIDTINENVYESEWFKKNQELDLKSKEEIKQTIIDKSEGIKDNSTIPNTDETMKEIYEDRNRIELSITEPSDGLITKEDKINIKGNVSKNTNVWINGKKVTVIFGKFQHTVPLDIGKNYNKVQARNSSGDSIEKVIIVIREKSTNTQVSPTATQVPLKITPITTLKPTPHDSTFVLLTANTTNNGIILSWEASVNLDTSDGFKLIRSTQPDAEYTRFNSLGFDKLTKKYVWALQDGKTYYFRVCQFTGKECGVYSNELKITAPQR